MKKIFLSLFLLICSTFSQAESENCSSWLTWAKPACRRLHQIWDEGSKELYFTGYAWHNRHYYTEKKLATTHYNEKAWGGGMGKGFYDEDGDWHGLYAMAFLDSHKHVQPASGYAFLKVLHFGKASIGAGYSVLVTMRPDIFGGFPFPGAVPWLSLTLGNATVSAAYIPGKINIGNVLFICGKWTFANS